MKDDPDRLPSPADFVDLSKSKEGSRFFESARVMGAYLEAIPKYLNALPETATKPMAAANAAWVEGRSAIKAYGEVVDQLLLIASELSEEDRKLFLRGTAVPLESIIQGAMALGYFHGMGHAISNAGPEFVKSATVAMAPIVDGYNDWATTKQKQKEAGGLNANQHREIVNQIAAKTWEQYKPSPRALAIKLYHYLSGQKGAPSEETIYTWLKAHPSRPARTSKATFKLIL